MESMLLIAEHWQECCGFSATSRSVVNCGWDIVMGPENIDSELIDRDRAIDHTIILSSVRTGSDAFSFRSIIHGSFGQTNSRFRAAIRFSREIRFHAAASLNLTNRFGLRKRVLEHTRISPKTKGIRRNIFPSPPPPIYPAGIANQSAKREGRGSDRKGKSAIPR